VSWLFELTPEGLKREEDVDRSTSITTQTGRKLDLVIIAVLTIPREFHSATWVSVAVCGAGAALYFGLIRARIARGEAGVHAADVHAVGGQSDLR
jgi:hypothetical protein